MLLVLRQNRNYILFIVQNLKGKAHSFEEKWDDRLFFAKANILCTSTMHICVADEIKKNILIPFLHVVEAAVCTIESIGFCVDVFCNKLYKSSFG